MWTWTWSRLLRIAGLTLAMLGHEALELPHRPDHAGGPVGAFSSMVVLGLWHGIEVRFLAFGVIHGLLLAAHMLLQERTRKNALAKRVRATRIWSLFGWAFVMNVAVWSHVFYATASWDVAMRFLRSAARLVGM